MKVIITNDSLDSLLSVQISTNGGQSYSTYSVSSLKDGLTFDCSPKDLKVICDVNTLKYIQVLADGEKASSSDIDLSNYLKIIDYYVDVYKNPYYGKELSDDELKELSYLEKKLYEYREYKYYYKSELNFDGLSPDLAIDHDDYYGGHYTLDYFHIITDDSNYYYFHDNDSNDRNDIIISEGTYLLMAESSMDYLDSDACDTNRRVHFTKHF